MLFFTLFGTNWLCKGTFFNLIVQDIQADRLLFYPFCGYFGGCFGGCFCCVGCVGCVGGLSGGCRFIKRGLSDYSCRTASWVHSEKQPDRLSLDVMGMFISACRLIFCVGKTHTAHILRIAAATGAAYCRWADLIVHRKSLPVCLRFLRWYLPDVSDAVHG